MYYAILITDRCIEGVWPVMCCCNTIKIIVIVIKLHMCEIFPFFMFVFVVTIFGTTIC